jgi:hypothetical protein
MSNFKFFVESKADEKFLKDYIVEIFQLNLQDADFDTLTSWSGYKAGGSLSASIRQGFEDEKKIILILDADNNFAERKKEVLGDFAKFGIPVELFLFPNNANTGSIESLLCEIAVERKILKCFEDYEDCIKGYKSPVVKSKVFAYLDALLPSNQKKNDSKDLIQDKNRDYRNKTHWNLQHEYLNSLKGFIQSVISP